MTKFELVKNILEQSKRWVRGEHGEILIEGAETSTRHAIAHNVDPECREFFMEAPRIIAELMEMRLQTDLQVPSPTKPCPHCGSSAYVLGLGNSGFQVHCSVCSVRGPKGTTQVSAIESWNKIVGPTRPTRSEAIAAWNALMEPKT